MKRPHDPGGCSSPITETTPDNPSPFKHTMNRGFTTDTYEVSYHGYAHSHMDALCHILYKDQTYNGHARNEVLTEKGCTQLSVDNLRNGVVTRGVLIDVAALKGVAQLEGGYEISVADINAALAREKVEIHAGDVVIFHTGWGSLWGKDNAKFNSGAPGPGLAAAQYLIDKKVVMVGADTWSMEVIPNPNKDLQFPVHQQLIPRSGIYIFENLLTEDLARDRAYEFAFFFAPLRLKGATGSPGNPLAIR